MIQKSNGAFDIILWNETPIWDITTATQVQIPTSTVTLTLPFAASGEVYDPIEGSAPITTFSNTSQLQLQLNDSALIVYVQ